jgi:hypothetical protein
VGQLVSTVTPVFDPRVLFAMIHVDVVDSFAAVAGAEVGEQPRAGRLSDYLCLGVVSRIYRRDLVDEVIPETRSKEKRNRLLPARLVVYYVIALALFWARPTKN